MTTKNKELSVAIQGVTGAFHEIAARTYFGQDIQTINCDQFKDLFTAVEQHRADYGIVAIENTIAGSILENYLLLRKSKLKVIGEICLHITQNLMVLPGTRIEDITEVYSHPIAIQQSKDFLDGYPYMKLINWSDTASSARKIAEEHLDHAAAIASDYAAKLYGLEIIAPNIQTHKQNFTRFLILSRSAVENPSDNKASICFELTHQPGSLVDVLAAFKQHDINLTKIQSLPILGSPFQYAFYVDLEWNDRSNFDRAIAKVLNLVSNLSVLGEYQRDSHEF
ncbi:MAG: prephenate dehydratase [Bacteroidales bacterium]|nr:prephenate dehydratase [Bacteroidales bacterium]